MNGPGKIKSIYNNSMKIDNAFIFSRQLLMKSKFHDCKPNFYIFFHFLGKLPNWGMDTVFLHQIILYALLWSRHTKIFLLVPIVTEMRKVKCFSAILVVSQLVIFVWHKFITSINQRQQFWRFSHLFSQNQEVYIFMAKINKLCVIPPLKNLLWQWNL